MLKSDVVEVDGIFVGTAIQRTTRGECAFVALHDRVRALHGAVLPSLADLRSQVTRHFRMRGTITPRHQDMIRPPPTLMV